MNRKRQIAMVAATFFLAAATGQYMQTTTPRPETPPVVPTLFATTSATPRPDMTPPVIPGTIMPTTPVAQPSLPSLAPDASASLPMPTQCGPQLTLAPQPGAMLALTLMAPCHAGERVVILSDDLSFTDLTGADGRLALSVPAMRDPARITVRFMGGQKVVAAADVHELADFHRIAVQWMAPDAFRIDALENGASFGAAGDISAKTPGQPAAAKRAKGGFLTVLGNASVPMALQAEVYSVPKRLAKRSLVIVEAPVTAKTCGRSLLAQAVVAGRPAQDVNLAMPDCNPANDGQFVALTGLANALAVASN
ncbi:MAG: hypothetical protein KGN33_04125 [Paracoccaceae bacterium]|nr:hypothetical protein [Paracoccaceae bacterium]